MSPEGATQAPTRCLFHTRIRSQRCHPGDQKPGQEPPQCRGGEAGGREARDPRWVLVGIRVHKEAAAQAPTREALPSQRALASG